MALTKAERDTLPESDFAVPGKRKLPIHDEVHVAMAWREVDRTQGLSDAERHEARKRILARAKSLGMDTSAWSKIKAMSMDVSLLAMSLAMPTGEHPNKMPFSGFLVWLDEPSDKPPHGSGGRKVVMTKEAADKAIPTLLGMGVNFTDHLDGHDPQKKIGIISEAVIRSEGGREGIFIDGFIYASDFPKAAARIRADKNVLGFSFEAQDIKLADPGADILAIDDCVFTGAAILRKDKAAFATTSLAAHAEDAEQEDDMTKEEFEALLATAMKPLGERLEKIEAAQADAPKVLAKAQTEQMVEPHAKALEACADGMEAAGIGNHTERGHVVLARKMAKHLRASAAMGQLPHIYRDHDFFSAGADEDKTGVKKEIEGVRTEMKAAMEALGTKFEDLTKKAFNASAEPARKTIPAEIVHLLAKAGLEKDAEVGTLTVAQVDSMLDAQNLSGTARIEAKLKLQAAGVLKQAA